MKNLDSVQIKTEDGEWKKADEVRLFEIVDEDDPSRKDVEEGKIKEPGLGHASSKPWFSN